MVTYRTSFGEHITLIDCLVDQIRNRSNEPITVHDAKGRRLQFYRSMPSQQLAGIDNVQILCEYHAGQLGYTDREVWPGIEEALEPICNVCSNRTTAQADG